MMSDKEKLVALKAISDIEKELLSLTSWDCGFNYAECENLGDMVHLKAILKVISETRKKFE